MCMIYTLRWHGADGVRARLLIPPEVDSIVGTRPQAAMSLAQVSTPLSRDQATALADAVMEREALALTASAYEDEATGEWVFEATTDMLPDLPAFEALAREVLGGDVDFTITPIDPEVNWVARSLKGLQPVTAGGI